MFCGFNFQGVENGNTGNVYVNALSTNPTEWSNTPKQFVGSIFDHFMGFKLKGLTKSINKIS